MTNSSTQPWTDLEDEVMLEEEIGEISELIVYNDDVNTFDLVIEGLMDVCNHTLEQADELSKLVHFK